jgi:hypothetical protein
MPTPFLCFQQLPDGNLEQLTFSQQIQIPLFRPGFSVFNLLPESEESCLCPKTCHKIS